MHLQVPQVRRGEVFSPSEACPINCPFHYSFSSLPALIFKGINEIMMLDFLTLNRVTMDPSQCEITVFA